MIFGKKKSAQETVDQAESWSGHATLLILGGIVTEIAFLFIFPHTTSIWELSGLISADAAIGIGLAIEYVCIIAAIKANAELKRESEAKLAEALDRAARAENRLVEYLTPRRTLIQPNIDRLAKELRAFERTKFDIGFGGGDGEQADFCWDVETLLAAAAWDEQQWGIISSGAILINDRGPSRPRAGQVSAQNVEIHLDADWRQSLLPAATAFISALNGIGIKAKEAPFNTRNANAQAIHILIGPKA